MKTFPNKFRPSSSMTTKSIMQQRRKYGHADSYNWQSRIEWYPVGFKPNHKSLMKQFGKLHYLACHSPEKIMQKWHKVYQTSYKKHFGVHKGASVRYLNNWSCHQWC